MPAAIGIVGAGPVAQALGRVLLMHGEPVVGLSSRTAAHASAAARFISGGGSGVAALPLAELARRSSAVLIATADGGISPTAEALAEAGFQGLTLHTSGAAGLDALTPLRGVGAACGVLHPLQTIVSAEAGVTGLRGIAFALAGDEPALAWARTIVAACEGRSLEVAPSDFALYHAGAVMASNALAAVVDSAVQLMRAAGIDELAARDAIAPLARTALSNVLERGPQQALTGPVVRGDVETVRAHMQVLRTQPAPVAELYRAVGVYLLDLARRRGLPEGQVRALASALEVGQAGGHDGP